MTVNKYPQVLMQGAESIITRIDEHTITKHRPSKAYRVKELDHKFTTHRTRSESKILKRLFDAGIAVPKLINTDEKTNTLTLEYINGPQVKELLNAETLTDIASKIGTLLAQIHNEGIVHSDFTTSNLLMMNNTLYCIDFGLSYISTKVEDKAVDLHLLNQALTSYHAQLAEKTFRIILESYIHLAENSDNTIERYLTVEKRGRNKH